MINDGEYLLVGGRPTPLKNRSSSVGMIIPNIWKNKKCSKPPTRLDVIHIYMMLTSAAVDFLLHPLVDIARYLVAPPSGLVCPILRQVAVVLFVNLLLT